MLVYSTIYEKYVFKNLLEVDRLSFDIFIFQFLYIVFFFNLILMHIFNQLFVGIHIKYSLLI